MAETMSCPTPKLTFLFFLSKITLTVKMSNSCLGIKTPFPSLPCSQEKPSNSVLVFSLFPFPVPGSPPHRRSWLHPHLIVGPVLLSTYPFSYSLPLVHRTAQSPPATSHSDPWTPHILSVTIASLLPFLIKLTKFTCPLSHILLWF